MRRGEKALAQIIGQGESVTDALVVVERPLDAGGVTTCQVRKVSEKQNI